jgi:eukaryotic-like serine/threonine-protein kinase
MQADRPLPPSIGRYEILRLLGQGAMGRVFLARDPVLDRSVALKLPRNDPSLEPDQRRALLERMRHEARASGRVSHPNIVALFDMGEDAVLGLYLVFEYVEGQTLKERLASKPLGPIAAARLAREMGDALSTAHAAGVLHRDIKPENVILAPAGSKIADFGIARVPDSTLTREGGVLGTPAYSAPEGILSGTFSPFSDQFSMAATLYEALSGCRAFPGEDTVQVASRITNEEVTPIARAVGLNPRVDEVLGRALGKIASERFASAREFGNALADVLEIAPRSRLPTLPDEHHLQAASTNTRRVAAGSVAIGVLLGVTLLELTHRARAVETSAAVVPSAASAPSVITGWLSPPARPRSARPSTSARERAAAPRRAGLEDPADAGAQAEIATEDQAAEKP